MKKLEAIIEAIDIRVDKSFGMFFAKIARHFSVFSSIILAILLGLFVYKIVHNRSYYLSTMMEQDMTNIA
ncbi:hypothetical protein FJ364_04390, partial [Candidatus Dependentiae bacterium]|nr:hypothetical protein [Candidatus Dependentiae bacterium]